jgi:hypothetical protein
VAQQVVAHPPRPRQPKETTHDPHPQPESR